jgi:Zn-finger nucleic acid-binding protein
MSTQSVKCPKCKSPTRLIEPEPNLKFDRCETCKGCWLDKGELAQFANLENDLPSGHSNYSLETKTNKICPRCEQSGKELYLYEIPYSFDQNFSKAEVFVDKCHSCLGLWLEANELGAVQNVLKNMRIQKKLQSVANLKHPKASTKK